MSDKTSTVERAAEEPAIIRPLGKMERSIWFCDQASPAHIGLGAEIQGRFTDDMLRSALRWCQLRYPLLRSVILPRNKGLHFACYEASVAPAIPLVIGRGTTEDEDALVQEEMRRPFDGAKEYMVRARLLRLDDDRSFLSIVFSHVIGDGYSAVLLLQEIVNYLGRSVAKGTPSDPEPLPFPPPSEEGIEAGHRGWSGMKKLFAFQKEVAQKIKAYGAQPSPVRVTAGARSKESRLKFRNFTLSEDETRALMARAKQENVSLFPLLGALLVDALHPLLESTHKKGNGSDRVVSFAAPVDMRPFLTHTVKQQFGFYSSAINHLCLSHAENDVSVLSRDLHENLKQSFLKKKVHLHTTPMSASFFSWRWLFPMNERGVARVAKMTEGMFKSCATSLTFLNDSIAIDDSHGMTMSRPRGHISPSIMGAAFYCVLFYKDRLSFHLNYNEGQFSDSDAELLNERFKDNARAAGRSGSKPGI
jgi:hypothetical protein